MLQASISHFNSKYILEQLNESDAKEITDYTIEALKERLKEKTISSHEKKFIESLIKLGEETLYLFFSFNPAEPGIYLVSKNLKGVMCVALNTTDKKFIKYFNSPLVLDLLHIHSFKKGEGTHLIGWYKKLQEDLNIPGSLWTEIENNVEYFKRFGFESLGNLGSNGEYLMKLSIVKQ